MVTVVTFAIILRPHSLSRGETFETRRLVDGGFWTTTLQERQVISARCTLRTNPSCAESIACKKSWCRQCLWICIILYTVTVLWFDVNSFFLLEIQITQRYPLTEQTKKTTQARSSAPMAFLLRYFLHANIRISCSSSTILLCCFAHSEIEAILRKQTCYVSCAIVATTSCAANESWTLLSYFI